MRQTRPRRLDARQLLSRVKGRPSVAERAGVISRLLLGRPYVASGLVGSAETPEVLSASLDAFDCVTYVETVLALARSRTAREFPDVLRCIRYEGGQVAWERRNHYMTGWIRSNARSGVIRPVPAEASAVWKERLLDAVPGLPPRPARFACIPKARMAKFELRLATGDLIFFVSTRPHLDVFHCGILVRDSESLRMRHAAKSRGGVVEQDLDAFLKANRMAGVMVMRPLGEAGA